MLFELILAANFLDVRPLLDLVCKAAADMIRGKTPDEIRKKFNIVCVHGASRCRRRFARGSPRAASLHRNDLTPEEETQIRKEVRGARPRLLARSHVRLTRAQNEWCEERA